MDHMEAKMQDRFEAIEDAIREAYENGVRDEREACARIVEKFATADAIYPAGIRLLVDAIRARSNHK